MKIVVPKITNTYTCQICKRDFDNPHEMKILLDYSPLCSNRCVFLLYYKIISKLETNTLFFLSSLLKIPHFDEFSHNQLIFEVTKKYPKPSLSSINRIVTCDTT